MTESLTKEERIQLSTRWPPDTKLYLKLLRVHDEMVADLDMTERSYSEYSVKAETRIEQLETRDRERDDFVSFLQRRLGAAELYARSLMGDSNDSCMSEDIAHGFLEAIK